MIGLVSPAIPSLYLSLIFHTLPDFHYASLCVISTCRGGSDTPRPVRLSVTPMSYQMIHLSIQTLNCHSTAMIYAIGVGIHFACCNRLCNVCFLELKLWVAL